MRRHAIAVAALLLLPELSSAAFRYNPFTGKLDLVGVSPDDDCSNATTGKLLWNATTKSFSCGTDQTAVPGAAITSLNALTASIQTLTKTDDTNVTLSISSVTDAHTFALGWTGALAKARQHAATVYTDQANTFGAFLQAFRAFEVRDTIDDTKRMQFDLGGITTGNTQVVTIPDASSNTVRPSNAIANQFLTGIGGDGAITRAQPAFTGISGTATITQLPAAAAGSAGTTATNNGSATTVARSDHEHRVPWQVGMSFEATPATGEFAMPLPVNNQCGGSIDAVSVSIAALNKGTGTMTFNVIRYSAAGVSAGNLYLADQSYSNLGDNRQSFATNQNSTGIASSDYFRLNIVTINGQDDFSVTVQGKCKNVN